MVAHEAAHEGNSAQGLVPPHLFQKRKMGRPPTHPHTRARRSAAGAGISSAQLSEFDNLCVGAGAE
eukprot:11989592-Prorocentrum_lima.AAC.1